MERERKRACERKRKRKSVSERVRQREKKVETRKNVARDEPMQSEQRNNYTKERK